MNPVWPSLPPPLTPFLASADEMYRVIAEVLDEGPACAPFRHALKQCVQPSASPRWPLLPILCCQAVGGPLTNGVVVAAAFEMARIAAHILDDVQDGDTDGALWCELGRPQAINLAVGLTCAAHATLVRLERLGVPKRIVALLQEDFARVGFEMCGGQHLDLLGEEDDTPSLERYWDMAAAKSATFFALGCRAGAQAGCDHASEMERYSEFGYHFGLLAQIANDLAGLFGHEGKKDLARRKKTLPLVYALTVAPPETKRRLQTAWDAATNDPTAEEEVRQLVMQLGGAHYLLLAAESSYRRARSLLSRPHRPSAACTALLSLLDQLRPSSAIAVSDGPAPERPICLIQEKGA